MNDLSTDLSAGLDELAGDFAPPCIVDVDLARARGRSAKRRRHAVTVGSGLATTGLAAAILVANLPGAAPATGVGPGSAPGAGASATGAAHFTGTDPLTAVAAFGWLPDDVHTTGYTGGVLDEGSAGTLAGAILTASGGGTQLSLTVLPLLETPLPAHFKGGALAPQTPAPDVNGRSAYWTDVPGSSQAGADGLVELRWQYAANSWASLDASVGQDTSTDIVAMVYQVAENVQYKLSKPVALPYHLAQAPSGLAPMREYWAQATTAGGNPMLWGSWGSSLTFDSGTLGVGGSELTIMVDVADGKAPTPPRPPFQQIEVDGHSATLQTSATGAVLMVSDVDGLNIVIDASGQTAMADVNAVGGIVAYFHTLTLLGPDPSDWTTSVIG